MMFFRWQAWNASKEPWVIKLLVVSGAKYTSLCARRYMLMAVLRNGQRYRLLVVVSTVRRSRHSLSRIGSLTWPASPRSICDCSPCTLASGGSSLTAAVSALAMRGSCAGDYLTSVKLTWPVIRYSFFLETSARTPVSVCHPSTMRTYPSRLTAGLLRVSSLEIRRPQHGFRYHRHGPDVRRAPP